MSGLNNSVSTKKNERMHGQEEDEEECKKICFSITCGIHRRIVHACIYI